VVEIPWSFTPSNAKAKLRNLALLSRPRDLGAAVFCMRPLEDARISAALLRRRTQ